MSNSDRPEFMALDELEEVVSKLTDELAAWRRRALKAEAEQRELGEEHDAVETRRRIKELEADKAELEHRVTLARERVSGLLDRMNFLEDQVKLDRERQ